jgi:hypothetical protein
MWCVRKPVFSGVFPVCGQSNFETNGATPYSLGFVAVFGAPDIAMVAKVAVIALAGVSGAAGLIKLPLEKRNPITIQQRLEMERSLTVGYTAQGTPTSIVINDYQ